MALIALLASLGYWALLTKADPGDHTSRARCELYQWAWNEAKSWSSVIDCSRQGWQPAGLGQLKTTATAQILQFERTGRYAKTYTELVNAGLLIDCSYTGYTIRIVTTAAAWSATSVPFCSVCTVGGRSFYADQTRVIRVAEPGEPPPTGKSPPL